MHLQKRRSFWLLTFGCLVLLAATGCGPTLAPVKGNVKFPDGSPLTAGTVVFDGTGEKPYAARGEIQSDGTFTLSTFKAGDGAPIGTYKVAVAAKSNAPLDLPKGTPPPPPLIDQKFARTKSSKLEFEVKPGPNEFSITVTKPVQ